MADGIKTVIWDMGGVLLRSEDWDPRIQLGKEFGLTLEGILDLVFNSDSAKQATLGKIDEETHWKTLGNYLDISDDTLISFRHRFWEGDRLDNVLVDFIRSLKPDYTTALLSNAWSGARKILSKSKPCLDAFHVSVFSCEIGLAKPDPQIYRYLLRLCAVEPEEAIFVDDAVENIEAANQLGIHGIFFKNTDQVIREVIALLKGE